MPSECQKCERYAGGGTYLAAREGKWLCWSCFQDYLDANGLGRTQYLPASVGHGDKLAAVPLKAETVTAYLAGKPKADKVTDKVIADVKPTPKTERQYAIEAQARLFPTVQTGHGVRPNLCDICLEVRSGIVGESDPRSSEWLEEVRAMLDARVKTWEAGSSDVNSSLIDNAVNRMVRATIDMIYLELQVRCERGSNL